MSVTINASTSTGLVQSADTSGEIELQSNGTTALKVNTNEGIQILNCLGVGNATPSTSGAGITFPATQSASSDANTLDDYEEGTWTPAASRLGTAPTGVTYSSQTGTYTKIGNLVTAYFDFTISGISTAGSGQNAITNFPFAADGSVFPVPNYRACSAVPAGPTATTRLAGYLAGTQIYLETDNIGNAGFASNGIISGNWTNNRVSGWVTYRI